jgi:DNA-binding IclR family transcriptional regulator
MVLTDGSDTATPASSGFAAPTIKVLVKMSDVLTALAEHDSLNATQIAEIVQEPRSSIYRLLRTMRQYGYVDRARRGEFILGERLLELGAGVAARFNLREAALPHMWELRDETDGTVLLYVKRGDRAICVERFDGRYVRWEIADVGDLLPLHAGAAPRLMLALSTDEEISQYLDGATLEATTKNSPVSPRQVRSLLAEIRRTGVAISDQDLVIGVASIAAPIWNHDGEVVGAMSYSGLAATLLGDGNRDKSIELIRTAALATSHDLGWHADRGAPGYQ